MIATLLALVITFAFTGAGIAAADSQTRSCDTAPYHQFDFWIGNWRAVSPSGEFQGANRIVKSLGGCAIHEYWKGSAGDEVESQFYYSTETHRWVQLWISDGADKPGGLKQRHVVAQLGPSVRLQGEIGLPDGRVVLDRSTLTPEGSDRVHQVIELSRDGGATWVTSFEVYYVRDVKES